MAKSARTIELEESIAQAVATMDETDASRIGLQEAFDSAREILGNAYGNGFENAVAAYLSSDSDDEDEYDEDDEDDED